MKVEQFYNNNQFIIYGKNEIVFQSYESTIATIKKGTLTLGEDWNYSNTTRKHLYLFLDDYLFKIENNAQRLGVKEALRSTNKKEAIKKLIANKIIKVKKDFKLWKIF